MIKLILPFAALALVACAGGPVGNTSVPEPAKAVDAAAYAGRWYEFARYENRFEKDCEGVTAEYAVLPDGKLSVLNTCRKGAVDGKMSSSQGKAKPVGDPKGAKFKVSFFGPFYVGDYWVLDHADDYSWSIVGEDTGTYLWVLTREPTPTAARRDLLLGRVQTLGYATGMLRITKQSPA